MVKHLHCFRCGALLTDVRAEWRNSWPSKPIEGITGICLLHGRIKPKEEVYPNDLVALVREE